MFPLRGLALDKDLVNMDGILKENRQNLLFEHFVKEALGTDVPITMVYTTEEFFTNEPRLERP